MPLMPRNKNNKATKIAFSILGVPANLKKRSKKDKERDRRLMFEETFRVR